MALAMVIINVPEGAKRAEVYGIAKTQEEYNFCVEAAENPTREVFIPGESEKAAKYATRFYCRYAEDGGANPLQVSSFVADVGEMICG